EQGYYQEQIKHPSVMAAEWIRETALAADPAALKGVSSAEWFQRQTDKINLLKAVEDRLSADLTAKTHLLQAQAQLALRLYEGLTLLALLMALAFGVQVTRSLTRPLREMTVTAIKIAEGDVTQQVRYVSRDEIGVLADAFRGLIAYNKEMAAAAQT